MKAVAVFYEKGTKENYYKPLKVIRRICKSMTEREYIELEMEMLGKCSVSLSFCWYLPTWMADEIEAGWKVEKYEYEAD